MKLKILQIITRSDWAGGQKVLYSIAYGIKKYYPEQFDIEVACGKENGALISELEEIGVKVHIIDDLVREISPIRDFKAFLQIKRLIKQGKYDVVHLHSSKAGFLGRIAAKLCKVKNIIYTVHGWWSIEQYQGFKRKLFIFAERFAAKFCNKIVLLCERDMEKAKAWKIGKESQYVIIPNAIVPIGNVQKGKLRKELNLSRDIKIIGNVARLDPPKNPLRFLEVAKATLKERRDVVFVWIGGSVVEDTYGKKVEEWLKRHPQEAKYIHFLPFRKDAIELMADFDVLLLTSDAEGMPLVVIEAQNLGIPVVSTDVGCVRELTSLISQDNGKLSELVLDALNEPKSKFYYSTFPYKDFVDSHISLFRGEEENERPGCSG
ncbi:glycosyltransferase [Pseudothermotoga sp.]|nr:glycosyltransferase [Pseudothermotoga sp.]MDW8140628.1 glycosyltransferase [Pseudothermotoga sp.]